MTNEKEQEVKVDNTDGGNMETDTYLLETEVVEGENGNKVQVFKHREAIQAVSTEFMKKNKYTQEDLDAYLKENKYPMCTVSDLEDLISKRRAYDRQHASTQFVIKQLAKLQSINPFIHSPEQVKNLYAENDKIQFNILDNLSKQGISYRAMADVLRQSQVTVSGVLQEMTNRVANRRSEIERVALYEQFGGRTDISFKEADDWLNDVFTSRKLANRSRYGYEQVSKETNAFTKTDEPKADQEKSEGVDNSVE